MKRLFLILFTFILCSRNVFATDYYVSPTGSDSNNGTSQGTAWKTLARVQTFLNGPAQPGDRVLFQRGQVWTGTLLVSTIWGYNGKSGTRTNPIYIGAYGTGAKPRITGATTRGSFTLNGVKNYIIDGLNFEDTNFDPADKVTAAPTACGIRLGQYEEIDTDSITIKNCSFSNIGLAVVMDGSYNKMDSCVATNMKNVKSTYSTTFPGNDDDYGANTVTIYGNYNEVTHCYISGAWAESWDYGWNGGAIEFFDNCNYNKIMYNVFDDCGAIAEFGAYVTGATAYDNIIAYNRIINCGSLSYINYSGTFQIDARRVTYLNNTIIEGPESRFSGPKLGFGVVTPEIRAKIEPETNFFNFPESGAPAINDSYVAKNNVFYIANSGYTLLKNSNVASKVVRQNNVYKFVSGSTLGGSLGTGDILTTAPLSAIWESPTGVTSSWVLTPAANSVLINAGQNLGYTVDLNGKTITGLPDVGAYERSGTVTQPFRALLKFVE